MAASRFRPDHGLTARMTVTMFLLGGLFVVVIVGAMLLVNSAALALVIGAVGLGIVWFQWYNSDTTALRAMRAREVTPQEAPELHAMVDRLCLAADLPKPRVAIAYNDLPNAFATGRSPARAVVCVTTGIMDRLTVEELEGVMAHELAHVAHRDVLVMTLASSAGIITGMVLRGAQFGGLHLFGSRRDDRTGVPTWLIILLASALVYAVSFVATRTLSRYRELSADRAAAYLTQNPAALGRALQQISADTARRPAADLREVAPVNALLISPAVAGLSLRTLTSTHPSLEQRLSQLAKIANDLQRPLGGPEPWGPASTETGPQ